MTQYLDYDHSGELHRKHPIRISLLTCSLRPKRFKQCVKQLADTCTNTNIVEILLKVDTESTDLHEFQQTLQASPFDHRILCSPKLNGYWSLSLFLNELTKLARGEVFWYIADEMKLQSSDWTEILLKTRNVYTDNIYLFSPRGEKIHPKYTGLPAISKEWFDTLGFLSPFPEVDIFLIKMAMFLKRFYTKDTIAFKLDEESWRLHDRSQWRSGRNWTAVKKSMDKYIEHVAAHLFLARMSDPKRTPIPCDVTFNWT